MTAKDAIAMLTGKEDVFAWVEPIDAGDIQMILAAAKSKGYALYATDSWVNPRGGGIQWQWFDFQAAKKAAPKPAVEAAKPKPTKKRK
jgi:hypothetical protein